MNDTALVLRTMSGNLYGVAQWSDEHKTLLLEDTQGNTIVLIPQQVQAIGDYLTEARGAVQPPTRPLIASERVTSAMEAVLARFDMLSFASGQGARIREEDRANIIAVRDWWERHVLTDDAAQPTPQPTVPPELERLTSLLWRNAPQPDSDLFRYLSAVSEWLDSLPEQDGNA